MPANTITKKLETMLFSNRLLVISVFSVFTVIMFYSALNLRVDAGFSKLLPQEHEYMKTFAEYRDEFGGANRILVALIARDGNMFTPQFPVSTGRKSGHCLLQMSGLLKLLKTGYPGEMLFLMILNPPLGGWPE